MTKSAYMSLIKTYSDNLAEYASVDTHSKEDDAIYALSFFGLMKAGCPFKTETVETAPAQDTVKPGKKEEQPANPAMAKKIVIKISNILYECTEDMLYSMFGQEYTDLTAPKKVEKAARAKLGSGQSVFSSVPDADFDFEEDPQEKEKGKEKKQEAQKERPRIQVIEKDSNYPDDPPLSKEYTSFLFNRHEIELTRRGRTTKYTAAVYPLTMDTRDAIAADIMVVVMDDEGSLRCIYSDPAATGTRSVNAEFSDCTLVFRAEWKGGEFLSSAGLLSAEGGGKVSLKDNAVPIRPGSDRTSSFYLRHTAENGDVLSAFPVFLLKNDETNGIAKAGVMVENGYEKKIYSLDSSMISVPFGGEMASVSLYWAGNSLVLDIV